MSDSVRLAEAVLDGDRIDWSRVASGGDAITQARIDSLRALERIAQAAGTRSHAARDNTAGRVERLASNAIVVVATFQILAAAVGYVSRVDAGLGIVWEAASIAAVAAFAGAAAWLLIGGRRDDRIRYLGIFFLVIATAFGRRFLRLLLASGGGLLVLGIFPDAFLALFLWKFIRRFPRIVRFSRSDRWCALAERAALCAGLILFVVNIGLAHGVTWLPDLLRRSHPLGAYWAILVILSLPAAPLAWLRGRSTSPHERRRLALFTMGLGIGIALPLLEIVPELLSPAFHRFMSAPAVREWASPLFFVPLLTVPFVTAYAVIVDRVLDVRVVIGRTLQYALTRTAIALATFLPVGALVGYGYRHRDVSVAVLLSGRLGMTMTALAAAGVLAWAIRGYALAFVNRRFLRTEVDLAQALANVSAALRNARSTAELADLLDAELVAILRVDSASVFLADSEAGVFAPVRKELPALAVDGALGVLFAASATPLSVAPRDRASLTKLLPRPDRDWLARVGASLIVPLVGPHDVRLGLLVLGQKGSEIPFGPDERSFFETVGATAALAVDALIARERAAIPGSDVRVHRREPASECPACGCVDASAELTCACGARRVTASVPPILAGKFQVERRVGAGGMGVVYRARDLALDRVVALKTLPRLSGGAAERLGREARIMASVTHPNLATIFGIEWWRKTPIIVAEFLEGGTLADRAGCAQPIDDVLRLGVTLASALELLHAAGVLHRDIKPSNIAFGAGGAPKLLDFGLASLIELDAGDAAIACPLTHVSATQSFVVAGHAVAGTPLYLSPEAARGEAARSDFDVWSLSLVLYEAIAGGHPFAAATVDDVLRNVRLAQVTNLRRLRGDCSEPVASAFTDMLSADRSRRPSSAEALRRVLERLVSA